MKMAGQILYNTLRISLVVIAGMVLCVTCSIAAFEIMATRQCLSTNGATCYSVMPNPSRDHTRSNINASQP